MQKRNPFGFGEIIIDNDKDLAKANAVKQALDSQSLGAEEVETFCYDSSTDKSVVLITYNRKKVNAQELMAKVNEIAFSTLNAFVQ